MASPASGAERWRCAPCALEFVHASQLLNHEATHVKCPVANCAFAPASRKLVLSHFRAVHGGEGGLKKQVAVPIEQTAKGASAKKNKAKKTNEKKEKKKKKKEEEKDEKKAMTATIETQNHQLANGTSTKSAKKAKENSTTESQWYCIPCEKDFATLEELRSHQAAHVRCSAENCSFAASRELVARHVQQAHNAKAAAKRKAKAARKKTAMHRMTQLGDMTPPELMHHAANATLLPPDPEFLNEALSSDGHESRSSAVSSGGYESSSSSDSSEEYESSSLSSYYALEETVTTTDMEEDMTMTTQPSMVTTTSKKKDAAAAAEKEEKKPSWHCEACDRWFAQETHLADHCADHLACPEPGCAFKATMGVVARHRVAVHGFVESVCGRCKKSGHEASACLSVAEEQPSAAKPALPWRCETCGITVQLQSQLEAHNRQHKQCPQPGCGFSASKRVLTKHLSVHHSTTASLPTKKVKGLSAKYVCNACGVSGDHIIFNCPKKLKRKDLVALQKQQQQQTGTANTTPSYLIINTNSSPELVVYHGKEYQVQVAFLDGEERLVLVKTAKELKHSEFFSRGFLEACKVRENEQRQSSCAHL